MKAVNMKNYKFEKKQQHLSTKDLESLMKKQILLFH